MSSPRHPVRSATVAALAVAATVLLLQEISTAVPSIGGAIRSLPIVAIALVVVTATIVVQLIRTR